MPYIRPSSPSSSDSSSSSRPCSSSGNSSDGSSFDPPTPPRSTSPLAPPDVRRGSSQSTGSASSSTFLDWQPPNQHLHPFTKTFPQIQRPMTPPWSPDRRLGAFAVEPPAGGPSFSTGPIDPLGDRPHPTQQGPASSTSIWQGQGPFGIGSLTDRHPSTIIDDDDDDDDDSQSRTNTDTTYSERSSLDSRTSLEDQDQGTTDRDHDQGNLPPCLPVCVVSEASSPSSSVLSSPSSPPSLPSSSHSFYPPRPIHPPRPPSLPLTSATGSRLTYALSNSLLHDDILPKDSLPLSAFPSSHPSSPRYHNHHRRRRSHYSSFLHSAPRLSLPLKLVHTVLHILIPCLTFFTLGSIALWAAGTVYYYLGLWIFGFWSDAYKHCFWVMVGLACLGFAYYGFWLVVKIGSGLADTWDIDLHALDDIDWVNTFVTVDPRSVNPEREQDVEIGLSYRNTSTITSRAWSSETERI